MPRARDSPGDVCGSLRDPAQLVLIVQLKQGQTATREDILKYMDGKIAKWWMPDDIVFVDGIPHTATGKILKTALRDQFKAYSFPNAAA